MTTRLLILAGIAACLFSVGCSKTRACKGQTLFVSYDLGAASKADSLRVSVSIGGGTPKTNTIQRTTTDQNSSLEIDFPNGYPVGKSVDVTVVALSGSTVTWEGNGATILPANCGTLSLVASTNSDLGVDLAAANDGGSTIDMQMASGADMTAQGDLGPPNNVAFITSSKFSTSQIGGLSGADALCSTAATNGHLSGHFVALLSTSTVNAKDRLAANGLTARGWVGWDGLPFGDRVTDVLPGGQVLYPLQLDESGHAVDPGDYVWTGTLTDGTRGGTSQCNDWQQDSTTTDDTMVGSPGGGPGVWTGYSQAGCNNSAHLYCFQVDYQNPISLPTPASGAKLMYLTQALFEPGQSVSGGSGLGAANSLCDMEKPSGVTSVLAFIAGGVNSPGALLNGNTTYVRPDGVVLGTGADFEAGALPRSGIWQHASGSYALENMNSGVWTGSANPASLGTSTTTCSEWSSIGQAGGIHGFFGVLSKWWDYSGSGFGGSCAPTYNLYCVQQ
jgi:hypothetical protein